MTALVLYQLGMAGDGLITGAVVTPSEPGKVQSGPVTMPVCQMVHQLAAARQCMNH